MLFYRLCGVQSSVSRWHLPARAGTEVGRNLKPKASIGCGELQHDLKGPVLLMFGGDSIWAVGICALSVCL